MVTRSVIAWFGLLALAVANGAVREAFLTPRVGGAAGHGISTVLLSVGILAVGWLSLPWIAPQSVLDAWPVASVVRHSASAPKCAMAEWRKRSTTA